MIRNAADLEELIQNSLDDIDSASDETILPQVQEYFEQGGAASELVKALESKMNCAVCMEIPVKGCQMTECQHVFCLSCLKFWFLNNKSCPLCRSETIYAPRHLTSIDLVVNKIMRTHDLDDWEKRLEEDIVKNNNFVTKFCTEQMSKQMEQLREWEQTIHPDDMVLNEEGVFNILEEVLGLIAGYVNYLSKLPMTDENKQELVSSAIDLNRQYRYTKALIDF